MGIKQDFSLVTDYTPTKLAHTIGWIRRAGPCPEGDGHIFLHDESTSNGTFAYFRNTGTTGPWSTWTGGGIYKAGQDKTGIQFCRESFNTLPQTRNPYAVLQLSGNCPANGHSFARISDNEDTGNMNSNSGNISPSTQTTAPGHGLTTMWFCYVKGNGSSGDPPWKSRGQGAWANVGQTVNGGCDQMHWHHQDDENNANMNYFLWNQLANQADSTQIKANIFNNSSYDTGYLWNACQ